MPSSHTRPSNGIVHKQKYGSLSLLSGTPWVVWKWIEQRETIVHSSLQECLALATVNINQSASSLFIFPKTNASKESTLPMALLTHELCVLLCFIKPTLGNHYVQYWGFMYSTGVSCSACWEIHTTWGCGYKILLTGSNHTLDEWLCDSFAELIEEMELWKWNGDTRDFWSRLAKVLQQSNISVTCQPSSWTAD